MALDQVTQRNLELTRSGPEGKREDSLLWLLDRTETSMGGRMLKAWMLGPLTRASLIEERLEAVQEFFEGEELRRGLKETLKGVQDLERLMGRVCLEVAG
ncbi:MAG: DNA mismatch repair protein MutS, partial [Nitrospinota bacterium]